MSSESPFFRPGGTMDPSAPSYIERAADGQLFEALMRGEYVFLLDSRQKGKSSMVARAIVKLREQGVRTVKLDLQRIGANVTPEQWYAGLLSEIGQELGLTQELFDYWGERQPVGPLARWVGAIQEVVLARTNTPIVVFIDEIDFVRALPFPTDEFFAGIRDCYNRRSEFEPFRRLTFCLVGVATPGQLIRNPEITPFNIGTRIDISDFTREETKPFAAALDASGQMGTVLLDRVHYWANGHPYLTQLLCSVLSSNRTRAGPADVDEFVRTHFLSPESKHREPNLADVERRLLDPDIPNLLPEERRTQVLEYYRRLLHGKALDALDENPVIACLRLSGIAAESGGQLRIRNHLYRLAFGESWRLSSLPNAEARRQRSAFRRGVLRTGGVAAAALIVFASLAWANIRLAGERAIALRSAAKNADRAELEAYTRTMSLVYREAQRGKWLRVRNLLDRSQNSKYRGWEWDHWNLRLNGQREEYKLEGEVTMTVPDPAGGWIVHSKKSGLLRIRNGQLSVLNSSPSVQVVPMRSPGRSIMIPPGEGPKLIETYSGKEIVGLEPGKYGWLAGSDYLAKEGSGKIDLLHLKQNRFEHVGTFPAEGNSRAALVSPSGRWVCVLHGAQECSIRDLVRGTHKMISSQAFVNTSIFAYSAKEDFAYVATGSGKVHVLSLKEARMVEYMQLHRGPIRDIDLDTSESRLLTASADGTAKVYDLRTHRSIAQFLGHRETVLNSGVSLDGREVISGSSDGTVRIWGLNDPGAVWRLKDHHGQVNSALLNRDATRLVTVSDDGQCFVYDVQKRTRLLSLQVGSLPPPGILELSPDQQFAYVGGATGVVWKIDLGEGRVDWTCQALNAAPTAIAVSRDGGKLAIGSAAGGLAVVDLQSGEVQARRKVGAKRVWGCGFSPDGSTVVFGWDNVLEVCHAQSLRAIDKEIGPAVFSEVRSAVFSNDGTEILVCRVLKPYVVSDPGLKVLREFPGHTDRVFKAEFSPSGNLMSTISFDGSARIWDFKTGKLLQTLRHDSWVSSIQFTKDESRVITASDDRTVKIWSVENGEEIIQLQGPDSTMHCASFSGDGSTVVTGALDGTATVYFSRRSDLRR